MSFGDESPIAIAYVVQWPERPDLAGQQDVANSDTPVDLASCFSETSGVLFAAPSRGDVVGSFRPRRSNLSCPSTTYNLRTGQVLVIWGTIAAIICGHSAPKQQDAREAFKEGRIAYLDLTQDSSP